MLCQNCKQNDASTHLKRIINGEAAEIHLCPSCARSLGVTDSFPVFLPAFGMLGNIFGTRSAGGHSRGNAITCETCGFSFDDIVATGKPGCPDCYRVFGDKLAPTIRKLHGRAVHTGKVPGGANEETVRQHRIDTLRAELNRAIDEQNFEHAAQLRDEIRSILREG